MRRRGRGGGRSRCKSSLVYRGRCATARPRAPLSAAVRAGRRQAGVAPQMAPIGAETGRAEVTAPRRQGRDEASYASASRVRGARAAPLPRSAKPTHLSPLSDASTRVVLPAECQPSWACTAATRNPHPRNLLQRPPPLDHQVPISANLGNVAPHHSALRSSMCSRNAMRG